jgi:addiction module HigA family antidote
MASLNEDPRSVLHPGETVVDYLEAHEWSQSDLARRTGVTPKTISEICNGKAPISPTTALSLEKVFGRPAHFWLNLQRRFDEAQARAKEQERSTQWKKWAEGFPLREMKKRGWFTQGGPHGEEVGALLGFLGVSSPESWGRVWGAAAVSYRQTRKFAKSVESIAAWVRATELQADDIQVSEFSRDRLVAAIEPLRRLSRDPVDAIEDPARELCANAGVALVWIPELPHTGISGCARWLTPTKAMIALTMRYKTDDQLWFTLFHEVGHVLFHLNKTSFVIDNPEAELSDGVVDPEMQKLEDEANRFAADTLIPPAELSAFLKARDFSNDAVHAFSERIGVGPGIVIGRLQHEKVLARHQGNALKQRIVLSRPDDE